MAVALLGVIVLAQVLFKRGPIGYDLWAGIFAAQWMKVLTFVTIVALLYHDPKWQTEQNIRERYESSIIPGAWEALSAARLRSPVHQVRSTTEEFIKQLSQLNIPLLIMSCEHDPLNQRDWDVNFQKIVLGSKIHRFMHSAHEPQIEETEEFNQVLIEFLLG